MNKTQVGQHEKWVLYLAALGCPTLRIQVSDSESASLLFTRYRDYYGIGASDMMPGCGEVCNSSGRVVGHISYNGRAWDECGELMHEAV
jgi:hypothetical protein